MEYSERLHQSNLSGTVECELSCARLDEKPPEIRVSSERIFVYVQ